MRVNGKSRCLAVLLIFIPGALFSGQPTVGSAPTIAATAASEALLVDCNNNGIEDADDIANCAGDPACDDCNNNGIPDGCDIADCLGGPACEDCNADGRPDGCGVVDDCLFGVPVTRLHLPPAIPHWLLPMGSATGSPSGGPRSGTTGIFSTPAVRTKG